MNCKRKNCIHRRTTTGSREGMYICNYLLDTGKPRGCAVEDCDKYETKRSIKKKSDKPVEIPKGIEVSHLNPEEITKKYGACGEHARKSPVITNIRILGNRKEPKEAIS